MTLLHDIDALARMDPALGVSSLPSHSLALLTSLPSASSLNRNSDPLCLKCCSHWQGLCSVQLSATAEVGPSRLHSKLKWYGSPMNKFELSLRKSPKIILLVK